MFVSYKKKTTEKIQICVYDKIGREKARVFFFLLLMWMSKSRGNSFIKGEEQLLVSIQNPVIFFVAFFFFLTRELHLIWKYFNSWPPFKTTLSRRENVFIGDECLLFFLFGHFLFCFFGCNWFANNSFQPPNISKRTNTTSLLFWLFF